MAEELVGMVTHYFARLQVAAVKLSGKLRVGDRVRFEGHTTDFEQAVASMQIEHGSVEEAGPGDEVGILVSDRAREHDRVLRISE